MFLSINFFYFSFGIIFSAILLTKGIDLLKRYSLDRPNQRSLHKTPIPRGGGLFFIIPVLVYELYILCFNDFSIKSNLILLCIPLIIICFIDDLFQVPSIYRYLVQTFSAIIVLKLSPLGILFNLSLVNFVILTLLIILTTACINFTNFMDGSDGLVAGCMLILFLTLNLKIISSASLSILLGSLITFLCWNWPPAKIFMGDVGSNFLGIFFIANLIQIDSSEILGLLLIGSPLYGDALITLIRRFFSKQNIFKAHRQHLYQRLYLKGSSKRFVCLLYVSQCSLIAYTYIKLNFIYEIVTVFLCFFIMSLLELKYALSFKDSLKNS